MLVIGISVVVSLVIGWLSKDLYNHFEDQWKKEALAEKYEFENKVRTISYDVCNEHIVRLTDRIERLADTLGYKEYSTKEDPHYGTVYCNPYFKKIKNIKK